MLKSMNLTCRSDFFTDFTTVLRCTVNDFRLIFQWVDGCLYGFYGFFGYIPYINTYVCECKATRVRARKSKNTP